MAQDVVNAEAGGRGEAGRGTRTDAAKTGGNFTSLRRGASQRFPGNAPRRHRQFFEPKTFARTRSHRSFRTAIRNAPAARGTRSAGGFGAADRLCKRRELDDGAGFGAGAGDGRARFDRWRAMASNSVGAGAERLARAAGSGYRRIVCVVVGAVCREHDQSAGQSSAAGASRGLASSGFRFSSGTRGDFTFWVGARVARFVGQSG